MISLLIADDDPDHLALARLALEDGLSSCVIDTAETGQMVLEAFASKPFDVVLLDYRLPDMDGLAVLDELRRRTKPPPVLILLTGLGSEEVAATALRLGADDYVPKAGNYTTVLPAVIERAIQRRRMEALERELEAQKAIQRNKLAFLQSVNHELRTPLTMIVGYAELLARRTCAPEDVPSYCQEIYQYANRLSTLIERLLEAATLEPMEPTGMAAVRAADVREFLDEVIAEALETDPGRQIMIDGPEHAFALIDAPLFRRAVDEVLGNALKFSPPGEAVTVSVNLLVDSVAVIVKDRGPGIPPEERERVFLPFYRVENDSSITIRGLGLGLSRVRQVVSAQGGQVSVEDTPPGTGASVRLSFRRAALPDHQWHEQRSEPECHAAQDN